MPPEEDAALILKVALRQEAALLAALDEAFPQETWGFIAQQEVENLLKTLIVLADQQPPLSHALDRLAQLAGAQLPEELIELQPFAVKARYSPEETPLPASRDTLLRLIRQLREEVEVQIAAAVQRREGFPPRD
ncbi:HEPN domain-containing protein [Synechococcus sp. CS-1328]|uniref:HEPN domain-containing protein n=1 Tax=Synechococcus sp. CS-1328 TaxID=2847976 RepID=UPI00223C3A63|nr:HEPN domain-containing protein [Synechococcus sp. CS-1328]MCT0224841.1 HEPN domain-containing protein [Synechococcus sp. CS-1328]